MRGNKTERWVDIVVMIILSVFSVFTNFYFIFWQTYVMVIEVVLHYGAIGFCGLEVLIGIVLIITFK